MTPETAWIVLAEDNWPDAFLIREALDREGLSYRFDALEDGEKMLRLIDSLEADPQAECPGLFVIDLNLPKHSGGEILSRLRTSVRCAGVPVIVISSSDLPRNPPAGGTMEIPHFFRKPSDLKEFLKIGGYIRAVLGQDGKL
jgi:DNA-binding response OmpR family regulator